MATLKPIRTPNEIVLLEIARKLVNADNPLQTELMVRTLALLVKQADAEDANG